MSKMNAKEVFTIYSKSALIASPGIHSFLMKTKVAVDFLQRKRPIRGRYLNHEKKK